MTERAEGSIREEACTTHKHVLWTVEYKPMREEGCVVGCPPFSIGSQRYSLELRTFRRDVEFHLYRKGPSVDESVRWWAGLKLGDGSYHHWMRDGDLELKEECGSFTDVQHLQSFQSATLERNHVARDGRITVFFRMNVGRAPTGEEICSHSASEMSPRGEGDIREEVCSSHKHVLWTVDHTPLREEGDVRASPSFDVGNQSYLLELQRLHDGVLFKLCRMGPSVDRCVRSWAGLKRCDGSYVVGRIVSGEVDLRQECELWTDAWLFSWFRLSDLERDPLAKDGHMNFFFRMSLDRAPTGVPPPCTHGAAEIPNEGSIREDVCSSHTHVLWTADYGPLRVVGREMVSPVFNIGNQSYVLSLFRDRDYVRLGLYRMGPSDDGDVRWWAGLKCGDGSYHHRTGSEKLSLEDECELWAYASFLHGCRSSDLEKDHLTPDERLNCFFRMKTGGTSTGAETCTHGVAEMAVQGEGTIREEVCSSHKHVSWSVDYEPLQMEKCRVVRSPSFDVGNQSYVLDLSLEREIPFPSGTKFVPSFIFELYRMGPSVDGSVRWWAGLELGDGTFHHRIESRKLDLQEDCEFWTRAMSVDKFRPSDLEMDHLAPERHVTFCFFMDVDRAPTAAEVHTHSVAARGVGSIEVEEWTSYERVVWDVDCQPTPDVQSPTFFIENQKCFLQLSFSRKGIELQLNRTGPSFDRSLRWWAVAKRCNGTRHSYDSQCGELVAKEETCEVWRRSEWLFSFEEKERKLHLVVDFLVSLEAAPCTRADGEALLDLKPFRSEEVIIFRIKSEEFKIHRAVLGIRVPAFDGIFLQDSVENRTGVVDIVDAEPEIFRAFLNFVRDGDPREVNSTNACKLFSVADKYLFRELRSVCLRCLKDSLTFDTFFDVVELALRHDEADLLEESACFLSRNKNIVETEAWRDFWRDKRDVANELAIKAHLPVACLAPEIVSDQ